MPAHKMADISKEIQILQAAEGIIFHIWPNSWTESPSPKKRYPWQHYIAFTIEPAAHVVFKYVNYV